MKSKERNPAEWLRRANVNLEKVNEIKDNKKIDGEEVCFECQQASEKALKGVIVHLELVYPRTHSIRALLDLIKNNGYNISSEIWKAERLTYYSAEPRYPGDYEPVSNQEIKEAIKIAKQVVKWAEKIITEEKKLFK